VARTHDPRRDDRRLREPIKPDAFDVGASGSRLKTEKRRARLKLFALPGAQLARLQGPIGIYIGSKTPAEIAISIMAEMTAVKNGVPANLLVPHAAAPQPATTEACSVLAA